MKLSELMKDLKPKEQYTGLVTADDMVLAIDTTEEQTAKVDDYEVLQLGITGIDPYKICRRRTPQRRYAGTSEKAF